MTPLTSRTSPNTIGINAGHSSNSIGSKKRRRDVACVRCHSYKIKCSGGRPCTNCRNSIKEVQCVYPIKDRKVTISQQYLHSLEEEVKCLRNRTAAIQNDIGESSDPLVESPQPAPGATVESGVTNPLLTERPQLIQAAYISRPVYLGDASGIAFGMKVRQSMRAHEEPAAFHNPHRYFQNRTLLRMKDSEFQLPDKPYAVILIKLLKRFLGGIHHLNLESTFMARLAAFYDTKTEDPVWICRLFFIFALGELYSNQAVPSVPDNETPGSSFFLTAISLLQDLYEEATVLYVETLVLASLYSDALNRTNSAYAFIGLALRVSLTLGLHRNVKGPNITATDREHRHRVWWTVHYLERLCSSKLGHPVMLRDEDISTPLPSWEGLSEQEMADFPQPTILIAQLQLAKIVGFISRDMYTVSRTQESSSFLHSVSSIFSRLKEWNQNLPNELKLSRLSHDGERSMASLHLLFNQCVILTTRPVLFFVLQQCTSRMRSGDHQKGTQITSRMVTKLAESCVHAARNINKMVVQLWVNGSIAMFGYTDALFIFTSSMILMISLTLRYKQVEDEEAISNAWRILKLMREYGNKAAAEFYEQLELLSLGLCGPQDADEANSQASTMKSVLRQSNKLQEQAESSRPQAGGTVDHTEDTASSSSQINQVEPQAFFHHQHHNVTSTATWQSLDDLSLSLYLQADSANIIQNLLSEQQQESMVDNVAMTATRSVGHEAIVDRDSCSPNVFMHNNATPSTSDYGPFGAGVVDPTWDSMQCFNMAGLDDSMAWSIPCVWDEIP